ncbi:hypothetical protein BDV93DRAFT_524696 [Ceratobasidium sp. AG-I]|nr:hypothetical protein BDV93DRAFT_524696 [Ceratobasidium sp. AG-I]
MPEASVTSRCIGGIAIQVVGLEELVRENSRLPVGVLFVLHGRYENAKKPYLYQIANSALAEAESHASEERARELLVVVVEQRNHGDRVVERQRNEGWKEKGAIKTIDGKVDPDSLDNISHLHDMYTLYTGTVTDVSFLMTHLQPKLFPNDDRTIDKWMVMGFSLGAHATWHIAAHDPRVSLLIPIAGTPAYLTHLGRRAAGVGIPLTPPYLPNSLKQEIERAQPQVDSFKNKEILALAGADDHSVSFVKSGAKAFVDQLQEAGVCRSLEVWVQPKIAHECTVEMIKHATDFIWAKGLSRQGEEAAKSRL